MMRRRQGSGRRPAPRRGVALMLVLWLVVVLGTMAVGVAASVRGEVTLVGNLRARSAARYAAESGVVVAQSRLEALLRATPNPVDRARGFQDFERRHADLRETAVGSSRFGVAVADLNARLDLNHAEPETLRNFLLQFVGDRAATVLASAIEDWRDPDSGTRPGGAEAPEYARAGSIFEPSNGPFERLEEVRRVLGMSDSLAYRIAPFVTVDGDGRVNINSAEQTVLASLPGIGPEGARSLLQRRASGEVFTSAGVVEQVIRRGSTERGGSAGDGVIGASRTSTFPSRVLVISRGWQDGHPLSHEIQAVFAVSGSTLVLRAWRERDL